jgi:hypothetical protein
MGKRKTQPEDETTYEVEVWNIVEGDVVKKLWHAKWADVEALQDQYDDPMYEVQVEERP